jgi:TPR repeat protein
VLLLLALLATAPVTCPDTDACEKACLTGSVVSCDPAGLALHDQGEDERAAAVFKKGCDRRDVASCIDLGKAYAEGNGVDADPAKATTLFRSACEAASAIGCLEWAGALRDAGPQNAKRYADLYRRACEGGALGACVELGGLYEDGEGVAQDDLRARILYQKACDQGFGPACTTLGVRYQDGIGGLDEDPDKALELYRLGCAKGDPNGCLEVHEVDGSRPEPTSRPVHDDDPPRVVPPTATPASVSGT